jgi:hypothetical protein
MKRRATLPELTTYSFKPGSSHEIEISTIAETYSKAATLVTSPHRADFHQIVWVRSGKAKWLLYMETSAQSANPRLGFRPRRGPTGHG